MTVYRFLSVFAICALLFSFNPSSKADAVEAAGSTTNSQQLAYVPGQLVVGFKDEGLLNQSGDRASALAAQLGAQVVSTSGHAALLKFDPKLDVPVLVKQIQGQAGVGFAEPNFIYSVPRLIPLGARPNVSTVHRIGSNAIGYDIGVDQLNAMRVKVGSTVKATYPNDPFLWADWGWDSVGASMVWNNTTASKNVCVLDTGVDYLHKDLANQVIKGYDFVNADADPMDDFGHGTHVAGIIAAKMNNGEGMSGVSNGKVVAVKVLDARGIGTNWDVSQGLLYCAARTDVSIINLSLGGAGYSAYMESGVKAAQAANKLVVAAAGNNNTFSYCTKNGQPSGDLREYPAGYSKTGPTSVSSSCANSTVMHPGYDNVLAVGAYDQDDNRAGFSNYGSWVNMAGPGVDIYSTTPWDRPFTMNFQYGYNPRYDWMSGTSMATPFVAATAARVWGYLQASHPKTPVTYAEVIKKLSPASPVSPASLASGFTRHAGGSHNWPAQQGAFFEPSVAGSMDRGALSAQVFDAISAAPLKGALVSANQQTGTSTFTLRGSGVIPSYTDSQTDLINLPANSSYKVTVSLAGYTVGQQNAFVGDMTSGTALGLLNLLPGIWNGPDVAAVPPKTSNFTVVGTWGYGAKESNGQYPDDITQFDLLAYIPPNNGNGPFVVNPVYGNAGGQNEGDPTGTLTGFPYARYMQGNVPYDQAFNSIVIAARPTLKSLPYFPGTYTFQIVTYRSQYVLTNYYEGLFVWKDGVIKLRSDENCAGKAWVGGTLVSGTTGSPVYTPLNNCGTFTYP
jgi:subtilisin family serine protease